MKTQASLACGLKFNVFCSLFLFPFFVFSSLLCLFCCFCECFGKLERAQEAFSDALAFFREEKPETKELILPMNSLASVYTLIGKSEEAHTLLQEALAATQRLVGPRHVLTALTYNNMGYLLKRMERFADAEKFYLLALELRQNLLGPAHSDTIITRHNLAELYLAQKQEQKAHEQQHEILKLLGVDQDQA